MWRTIFVVTVLAAVVPVTIACTSGSSEGAGSPEAAARRMLTAIEDADQNEFLDALAPDERSLNPIDQAEAFLSFGILGGPAGKPTYKDLSFSIQRQEGDYAVVHGTGKVREAFTETDYNGTIPTRNVGGRWYVTRRDAPWAIAATATAEAQAAATSTAVVKAAATGETESRASIERGRELVVLQSGTVAFARNGEFADGSPRYYISLVADIGNGDTTPHTIKGEIRAQTRIQDCQ